ncbi:MAG TPA: DUF3306 domain-containing protein [Burkholderiales bacterium]|nr:DUF3306 domain-containing protein [Burkholderiales bacterium]
MTVAEEKEKFLSRWSRLKSESKELPQRKGDKEETPAPVLPPVENLTPESDFTGFMHPKVEDALRRAALKKLFSDPHFNVPDPYEPFSGDWTGGEPISEEMLATLNQARTLLFNKAEENKDEQETAANPDAAEPLPEQTTESKDDDDGRKDA